MMLRSVAVVFIRVIEDQASPRKLLPLHLLRFESNLILRHAAFAHSNSKLDFGQARAFFCHWTCFLKGLGRILELGILRFSEVTMLLGYYMLIIAFYVIFH